MSHPFYPSGSPKMNHVAMSLPAELLNDANRKDIARFWEEVFGFTELEQMTIPDEKLILSCLQWDQFIFLIAEKEPMTCPRLDHFGFLVQTSEELQGVEDRAREYAKHDDRVDLIERIIDDQGVVKIHSMYVRYVLPMMCEIQWWEFAK